MTKNECIIIDYGSGNTFSVVRAIERLGFNPILTNNPRKIINADRVILPGVGAFGNTSQKLRQTTLNETVAQYTTKERPFLGICVGMQLLFDASEEFGRHNGLGLVEGTVKKIEARFEDKNLRVPLIGWLPVTLCEDSKLLRNIPKRNAFYFVHSYAARVASKNYIVGQHKYGSNFYTSAVEKNNIFGVQFHPERSGYFGSLLLENFLKL